MWVQVVLSWQVVSRMHQVVAALSAGDEDGESMEMHGAAGLLHITGAFNQCLLIQVPGN